MKKNNKKMNASFPRMNRNELVFRPLQERSNKKNIESDLILPDRHPARMDAQNEVMIEECAERIIMARAKKAPVIMAFGAHAVKNGLGPIIIRLMENGWLTHLATNGAGIIHDWEFAFQGMTGEDVRTNVHAGEFGLWQETGFFINLALNVGAYEGKGYGEAVGAFIEHEKLVVPNPDSLIHEVERRLTREPELAAAAAELLAVIKELDIQPGEIRTPHPWKTHSIQAAAYRNGIPFTGHPMIGHDIIYCHPMNNGALLGKAALRDFLSFADSISRIENGVYLSVGSAVMSPMIFEKSLAMARNLAKQHSRNIQRFYILAVDIEGSCWNWSSGEPPEDNPEYYRRQNKTFSRMGGEYRSLTSDNRDFLLGLYHKLSE